VSDVLDGVDFTVGINGTRLSAVAGDDVAGHIEVETLAAGEWLPRSGTWADIGNLRVTEQYRQYGVATWLLGQRQPAGWAWHRPSASWHRPSAS